MTLNQIAATVRGRRQELGLSQATLAEKARVSRKWISEFEQGKPSAELGLVLRLLDALDLDMQITIDAETTLRREERAPNDLMAALEESLSRARSVRPNARKRENS